MDYVFIALVERIQQHRMKSGGSSYNCLTFVDGPLCIASARNPTAQTTVEPFSEKWREKTQRVNVGRKYEGGKTARSNLIEHVLTGSDFDRTKVSQKLDIMRSLENLWRIILETVDLWRVRKERDRESLSFRKVSPVFENSKVQFSWIQDFLDGINGGRGRSAENICSIHLRMLWDQISASNLKGVKKKREKSTLGSTVRQWQATMVAVKG